MKAAEVREKLIGATKRTRASIIKPAQRKYGIAKGVTATFSGDPDDDVLLDAYYVASSERLQLLSEIVAHVHAWKTGAVAELAPAGAWDVVGARVRKLAAAASAPSVHAPQDPPPPAGDPWEQLASAQGPLTPIEVEFLWGWVRHWSADAVVIPVPRGALQRLLAYAHAKAMRRGA